MEVKCSGEKRISEEGHFTVAMWTDRQALNHKGGGMPFGTWDHPRDWQNLSGRIDPVVSAGCIIRVDECVRLAGTHAVCHMATLLSRLHRINCYLFSANP